MPGGIDPHTHMQLPMMGTVVADDFYTGTAAAAAGGTTTILDFVGPGRGQSPLEALAIWRSRAAKATIDYGFHMTVSWWGPRFSEAMATLVRDHGITSFKFFLAYKGGLMLPDEDLIAGFLRCRELGALVQVHAENGELIAYLQAKMLADGVTSPLGHVLSRPPQCEGEATVRAIAMAEIVDVPLYVVHVSAARSGAGHRRCPCPRRQGDRRDAARVPGDRRLGLPQRRLRFRRRPCDEPALPAARAPGRRSGRPCRTARSAPPAPITAVSPGPRSAWATTTSPGYPMAAAGSRTGCMCCGISASTAAGSRRSSSSR